VSERQEGLARLNNVRLDTSSPDFLHLRSLVSDLEKASLHARGKLLDIGCGNKPYEALFASRVREHIGCDVVQSSDQRVDVICPATDLPFEVASYDTVLITQVIEHVADHRAMLAEAFRVLREGGMLIVSGPLYWPLHEEPFDFFRFTEHGLRFLLEGVGFVVVETRRNGGKWALCGQVLIHTIQQTRLNRPFLVRTINRLFARLDDRSTGGNSPMNYVVVARKPAAAPLEAHPE
jgi:SAM-dependent methyltransferase